MIINATENPFCRVNEEERKQWGLKCGVKEEEGGGVGMSGEKPGSAGRPTPAAEEGAPAPYVKMTTHWV